jgi:hypothetical protein
MFGFTLPRWALPVIAALIFATLFGGVVTRLLALVSAMVVGAFVAGDARELYVRCARCGMSAAGSTRECTSCRRRRAG